MRSSLALLPLLIISTMAGCSAPSKMPTFDIDSSNGIIFEAAGAGGTDIYRLDLTGMKVTPVLQRPDSQYNVAASPGDESVAFIESGSDDRSVVALLASKAESVELFPDSGSASCVTFIPGSEDLLYSRANRLRGDAWGGSRYDQYDLYVVSRADGTHRRLTREKYYRAGAPGVDPEGAFAYWQVDPPTSKREPEIVRVDTGSGRTEALLETNHAGGGRVAVSPDGSRIVFISDLNKDYDYQVYSASTSGQDVRQMTHDKGSKSWPVYSSDGSRIFYLRETSLGAYELWSVNVNGGKEERIAGSALFKRPLKWKPRR